MIKLRKLRIIFEKKNKISVQKDSLYFETKRF